MPAQTARKYRTALVGTGRGNEHRSLRDGISAIAGRLCDVDPSQLDAAVAGVKKLSGDDFEFESFTAVWEHRTAPWKYPEA